MRSTVKALVVIVIFLGLFYLGSYVDTHYTRPHCEVVAYTEDLVTVEDRTGREWQFYGEGYEVGDEVKLKMYTNHTDSYIYDDEIVDVKLVKDYREVE